jgi:hypothetical protein
MLEHQTVNPKTQTNARIPASALLRQTASLATSTKHHPSPVLVCQHLPLAAAASCAQVVRGAGSLYADTVLHIAHVSAAGAAQLAADAEYFANVMSALAVAPPPELITLQLLAGVPPHSFEDLAAVAVAAGSADVKVRGLEENMCVDKVVRLTLHPHLAKRRKRVGWLARCPLHTLDKGPGHPQDRQAGHYCLWSNPADANARSALLLWQLRAHGSYTPHMKCPPPSHHSR